MPATAARSAPWVSDNSPSAVSQAAIQLWGSCSDQPNCGRSTLSGTEADAMTRWSSPISSAFSEEVPRSRPR